MAASDTKVPVVLTPEPPTPAQDPTPAVALFDEKDPRSLINLLPEVPRTRIQEALFDAEAAPLFEMDELTLLRHLRENGFPPTPTDNRLRLQFWLEYDNTQQQLHKRMEMSRVFAGICTVEYFYKKYLQDPRRVAWLLCPPVGYAIKANEALEFGLEQLRDILSLDHGGNGKPIDHKLMKLKKDIFEILDVRVKGAPIQKNVNITAHATPAQAARVMSATQELTMEELEKKLEAARKKEKEMLNGRSS